MDFIEFAGWVALITLAVASVIFAVRMIRSELRERKRRDAEATPWLGATLRFTNGPQAGRHFRVKDINDGFIVLEEIEEDSDGR